MPYFVSSEQIQANFIAAATHFFDPEEETTNQNDFLKQFLPEGFELDEPKESIEDKIWQPCIWQVELLEITEDDLKQRTGLAPFHKKFKILSGPLSVVGQISYDDGSDIFDTVVEASDRASAWIDERWNRLEHSIQVKFVLS